VLNAELVASWSSVLGFLKAYKKSVDWAFSGLPAVAAYAKLSGQNVETAQYIVKEFASKAAAMPVERPQVEVDDLSAKAGTRAGRRWSFPPGTAAADWPECRNCPRAQHHARAARWTFAAGAAPTCSRSVPPAAWRPPLDLAQKNPKQVAVGKDLPPSQFSTCPIPTERASGSFFSLWRSYEATSLTIR